MRQDCAFVTCSIQLSRLGREIFSQYPIRILSIVNEVIINGMQSASLKTGGLGAKVEG